MMFFNPERPAYLRKILGVIVVLSLNLADCAAQTPKPVDDNGFQAIKTDNQVVSPSVPAEQNAKPADAPPDETVAEPAASEDTEIAPNPGVPPVFNDSLDAPSSLQSAKIHAYLNRTDGAWMRYALRLAESNEKALKKAIEIMIQLRHHPRDVSLDDVFDYHLGRLWLKYSDQLSGDEAREALKTAYRLFDNVQHNRKSPYFHDAREQKIKTALRLDLEINDELAAFIMDYPAYPGILDFRFILADRLYQADQQDKAIAEIQDLYFYYPWSPVSKKAEKWLNDHQIKDRERCFDEVFSRVESLRKSRFWDEAEVAAVEAMEQFPESYQLAVQHARIAYERSHHEEAANRFIKILERLNGETKDKLKPSGVIAYIYRAYGYMGNCEKALEYHAKNASRLGKKDRARSTMEFAVTCGALDVAWKNAKIVYDNPTDSDAAYYAFLAYLNGEYEIARQYYTIAKETLTGTYKRRAEYFLAQATLKQALKEKSQNQEASKSSETNKTKSNKKSAKKAKTKSNLPKATVDSAKHQFKALLSADSSDYYALLAASRLAELERTAEETSDQAQQVSTPVIQSFSDSIIQDPEPARPWYREFTFDEKASLNQLEKNIEKYRSVFPELERVLFFHEAELYRERNQLFRRIAIETMGIGKMSKCPTPANLWTTKLSVDGHLVDNRKHDTGVWGMQLDHWWFNLPDKKDLTTREKMASHQSEVYDAYPELAPFIRSTLVAFHDYYLARRYSQSPGKCGMPENAKICSTFYPHAYSHDVIQAAKENHITPDLIWAVMNIESAFNPDSISHADAYGLLQIIPMTGYKIANAMEDTEFGPYMLIHPEYSIKMGTWYFARILKKFQGYATLSMAAYNGGPHQVARWLTAYKDKVEHDAFIELIPYDEARNYVKKGMARLLIFHRIDQQDPKAFFEIPNTLPDSFEEMPNY